METKVLIGSLVVIAFGFITMFSNFMFGLTVIIIGLCIFVGVGCYVLIFLNPMTNAKKAAAKASSEIDNFNPTQKYVSDVNGTTLAIDENSHKIVVTMANHNYIFMSSNIQSTEVLTFQKDIIKTSKGSMIKGAVLGEMLAGGVGAVIGGLSADKSIEQMVRGIFLRIVINDPKFPPLDIPFMVRGKEISTKDFRAINALNEMHKWKNILDSLARNPISQPLLHQTETNNNDRRRHYTQDEIKKLERLLEDKEISIDEYNTLKSQLIKS